VKDNPLYLTNLHLIDRPRG